MVVCILFTILCTCKSYYNVNWKYQSKYNSDFFFILMWLRSLEICAILDFSVLITRLLFRHYESQEPGTYTLYRNKDPVGNINEVNFWLQKTIT